MSKLVAGSRVRSGVRTIIAGIVSFGFVAALLTIASLSHGSTASGATAAVAPSSLDLGATVTEIPIGEISTIRSGEDIVLPIDAYRTTAADQELLMRAEHEAMVSCMARFGLSWDVPAPSTSPLSYSYERLFGVLDLKDAQQYGYHPPGKGTLAIDGSTIDPVKQAGSVSLSADQEAVASGESALDQLNAQTLPEGGCIGESRARIGDVASVLELTESAVSYAAEQSDRDPRVLEAFGKWSRCMADAGYDYTSPWESNDDPQWATPSASREEIRVAVADVTCKNATNLTGLRVAVASAWQGEFIRAHSKEFAVMVDSITTQRLNASSIVADER